MYDSVFPGYPSKRVTPSRWSIVFHLIPNASFTVHASISCFRWSPPSCSRLFCSFTRPRSSTHRYDSRIGHTRSAVTFPSHTTTHALSNNLRQMFPHRSCHSRCPHASFSVLHIFVSQPLILSQPDQLHDQRSNAPPFSLLLYFLACLHALFAFCIRSYKLSCDGP